MKKIIALVVMALALSACTIKVESEPEARPETTQTQSPKTTETPTPAPQENSGAFVAAVRSEIPSVSQMSDDQLVDVGRQICTDLNLAKTGNDVLAYTQGFYSEVSDLMTEFQTGYLVGAAVQFFCPEKAYLIDELRQEAA